MNKTCSSCQFFRPFRPLSQLLMRDLGADDEQLMHIFLKMMEDERDKQDAEAEYRRELVRLRQEQEWRVQPTMSDYCGKREYEGVSLVAELKNPGGNCGDYENRRAALHQCETCRHRATGHGKERDAKQFAVLEQLASNAASLDQGRGTTKLEEYKNFVVATKCLEAAQAYYARKLTHRVPSYLPFCLKYSGDNDFVPCAVQNPHDACRDWTAADAVPEMSLKDALDMLR